jgi:hypothetical protein
MEELLGDPAIVKVVKIMSKASLSILELLEFGVTLKEVNHALANDIISFDRFKQLGEDTGVAGGDYYFSFLNSKVKLTDLGLLLLQRVQNK